MVETMAGKKAATTVDKMVGYLVEMTADYLAGQMAG